MVALLGGHKTRPYRKITLNPPLEKGDFEGLVPRDARCAEIADRSTHCSDADPGAYGRPAVALGECHSPLRTDNRGNDDWSSPRSLCSLR